MRNSGTSCISLCSYSKCPWYQSLPSIFSASSGSQHHQRLPWPSNLLLLWQPPELQTGSLNRIQHDLMMVLSIELSATSGGVLMLVSFNKPPMVTNRWCESRFRDDSWPAHWKIPSCSMTTAYVFLSFLSEQWLYLVCPHS